MTTQVLDAGETPEPTRPLVAYYHFDPVDEVWQWSEEMHLIHGYRPGEVELTPELLLELRHPEDRERVAEEIRAALRTAEPFSSFHRSIDSRGRVHHVVAVGAGAMDTDGTLVALEGYLIDLTPDVRREAHDAADAAVAAATETRAAIEQAKGVLMGIFAIDADSAFSMLRWYSQQNNVKLSLLAARFVSSVTAGEAVDLLSRERTDRLLHDLATHPDTASGGRQASQRTLSGG